MDYNIFREALNQMQAEVRSVNGSFENFINKELTISQGIRSVASNSHNALRAFLRGLYEKDNTFPVVLSVVDSDFIGGSYGRETKIWPLDDIDIYVPLDGNSLVYINAYGTLPYTVKSDGNLINNPILLPRWCENNNVSSKKLIEEFSKVLSGHYGPATIIKPKGEAVTIRMTHGETKTEDGLGYDIVPCFSLKSNQLGNNEEFYLIPDGNNGWLRTNPKMDHETAEYLNSRNNKTFKKVVKLVKYWNKTMLNGKLNSYYIEYAIAGIYNSKNSENVFLMNISYGLAWAFYALSMAIVIGNQSSKLVGAPHIEPGYNSENEHIDLITKCKVVSQKANKAWEFEKNNDEKNAISMWRQIFGDSFGE